MTENNDYLYEVLGKNNMPNGWGWLHQRLNFSRAFKIAKMCNSSFAGSSVLDVGSGTGDLSKILHKKEVKSYLGIDSYDGNLSIAKKRYPKEEFILADLLDFKSKEKFDFVIASGALSTRVSDDDEKNYEFMEKAVSKLWKLAKRGVYFNFLSADFEKHPLLFFYEPKRVRKICEDVMKKMGREKSKIIMDYDFWQREWHVYLIRSLNT